MSEYLSWGNTLNAAHLVQPIKSRFDKLPDPAEKKLLAYGRGRSYGDVCLNNENVLMPTRWLDKFVSFDKKTGILRCEAGVQLSDLLKLIIPNGYIVPVTPGTKFVTIGGMVANDVHGKNHHRAGSFGCHVREFTLNRSNDGVQRCSPNNNSKLYSATIGGLGLTGLITEVEMQLKPIKSANILQETIPFASVDEFIQLTNNSDDNWEYTVAWIDSLAGQGKLGRGVFFRGNHSETDNDLRVPASTQKIKIPFYLPTGLLNTTLLRQLNKIYIWRNKKNIKTISYDPFFYPLDSIGSWNRIYGKKGFYQYQCVVPTENAGAVLKTLLEICAKYHQGSFLSVLKKFGRIVSPGMLSFPQHGYTLALDFPNTGDKVRKMMNELDSVVLSVKGKVYPAKDARMAGNTFKQYYPQWREFSEYIDPAFSSSFWQRVMAE